MSLTTLAAAATVAAAAAPIDQAKFERQGMLIVDKPPEHCTPGPVRIADETSKAGKLLAPVWRPADYPDAGYYAPVARTVNGCAVPAPIALPNRPDFRFSR